MARKHGKDRGLFERPKGSGIWWVRLWHEGREHRFGAFSTKTEARAFYQKAKTEQREQRFSPEQYHKRKQQALTLSDLIKRYLETCTARSLPEQTRYGRWWSKLIGNRRLEKITTADLELIQSRLLKKGKKASATINRYYAFLRKVLYIAVRDGKLTRNPVSGVRFFKEPPGRIRFLSPGEELRLREVMGEIHWPYVEFALNTGLRQSEQFNLRWEHVNMEARILTIPRSKSGETRHVPLNDAALAFLKRSSSWVTSPWVFPDPDNPKRPFRINSFYHHHFKPAVLATGLEEIVWHSLRHTFVSRLVMAGVDLRSAQELAGHKTFQMTLRYAHLSPIHLRDAVEVLSRFSSTKNDKIESEPGQKPEQKDGSLEEVS